MKQHCTQLLATVLLLGLCLGLICNLTHPQDLQPEVSQPLDTSFEATLPDLEEPEPTPEPIPEPEPEIDYAYDANTLAVVNFHSVYGDANLNIATMTAYIEEAAALGVKLIVFPEMCVSGYSYSSDPEAVAYKIPILLAESTTGDTATTFSALAQEHDMWIVYGATETATSTSAFNSAFVCGPEGTVDTYRKIAPVEGAWCTPGTDPLIIDAGELGTFGVGICYDTYSHPELSQYYAAMGCDLYINVTASTRNYSYSDQDPWQWYYSARLESIAYQSGMTILSANAEGSTNGYNFPGGSVILDSQGYWGGTDQDGIVKSEAGLVLNQPIPQSTHTVDFAPELYAQWYDALSQVHNNPKYDFTSTLSPTVSLVNFSVSDSVALPVLLQEITQAYNDGADIVIFPSDALDFISQSIPGPLTGTLSNYAQQYQLYLLLGMNQVLDDGTTQEVVLICHPDGTVETHTNDSPTILQTQWGDFGVLLGDALYDTPELVRYYAAMGCAGLLHLDSQAPSDWQVNTLLETYSDRDGLAIASCNPTASRLITAYRNQSGYVEVNWDTGSRIQQQLGDDHGVLDSWDLSDTGFGCSYFNAERFSQWYGQLSA